MVTGNMQAIAAIQEKVLLLNGATLSHLSTGQIVNVVSNDVRRFDDLGPFWVFVWAGPLETAVVLTLISLEIGIVPAIAGVSTLLMVIPVQAKLAGKIAGLRARAATQTDERVRITGPPPSHPPKLIPTVESHTASPLPEVPVVVASPGVHDSSTTCTKLSQNHPYSVPHRHT